MIDAGHILNPKPARNQIEGAVVMGVGMALFEETVYDSRFGAPINNNLADYIVATNADAPEIDVTFLDYSRQGATMRLSLKKAAHVTASGVARQEIRVARPIPLNQK